MLYTSRYSSQSNILMSRKQNVKDWINERKWINPYWKKISNHPTRIFLEQDLYQDSSLFKQEISKYKKIICEFGSGSGQHLIELARRNPDTAVIGFELRFKRVVRTIEKSEAGGIPNTFVICGYAQNSIEFINSINEIYINFPDPWEKKTKNRLINESFLLDLSKLLKANGVFNFKTDHRDYFVKVTAMIESHYQLIFSTNDLHSEDVINIKTEFESMFLSQGLSIYALQAKLAKGN